jgi:hypothetical protein
MKSIAGSNGLNSKVRLNIELNLFLELLFSQHYAKIMF